MALFTVTTGGTINAVDVNQLVQVLQQPGGGQELGKYYLQGGGNVAGWVVSNWCVSLTRGVTPSGSSLDTSIQAPAASANPPSIPNLNSGGVQIQFSVTANTNTARAAGNYTISY